MQLNAQHGQDVYPQETPGAAGADLAVMQQANPATWNNPGVSAAEPWQLANPSTGDGAGVDPASFQQQQAVADGQVTNTVHVGTVTKMNYNHCRVTCEGFEGNTVYVHESVGVDLAMGDTVAFQIHVNAKGQPAASSPAWKLVGQIPDGSPVMLGDNVGRIARVGEDGTAFLTCPSMADTHGSEPVASPPVVAQCGITVGDVIAFCAIMSETGQPQVSAPCWKCISPGWRFDGLGEDPLKGKMRGKGKGKGSGNECKGGKALAGDLSAVALTGDAAIDENLRSMMASAGASLGSLQQPQTSGDESVTIGTVTAVNPNHCLVACEGFEGSVYMHEKVGVDLAMGDTVAFQIHMNARGQPQASSPAWKLVGHAGDGTPVSLGEHVGRISKIISDGSAFLACPSLLELHGMDPFAHNEVVKQCGLTVGDVIAFCPNLSNSGQPHVTTPCWKCCSPGWRFDGLGGVPAFRPIPGSGKGKGRDWNGSSTGETGDGTSNLQKFTESGEDGEKIVHIGTVSQQTPNHMRVTCEGFEGSVYVHESVGVGVELGDIMAFQVHINARGQPAASSPSWKLVCPPPTGTAIGLGDYVGKVTEIISDGSARINCPGLLDLHGSNAIADAYVVELCNMTVGDIVAFCAEINNGQPHVSPPCWKCTSPGWRFDGLNEDGKGKESKGAWKGKGKASMWKGKEWMDKGSAWKGGGWKGGGGEWKGGGDEWYGESQWQPQKRSWEQGEGDWSEWPPPKRPNRGNVEKAVNILLEALGGSSW